MFIGFKIAVYESERKWGGKIDDCCYIFSC